MLIVLASLFGRLFQRKGGEEETPPAPHSESEQWAEEDDDYEPEERYGFEEETVEEERPKRKAFDLGEVLRDLQEKVEAANRPPEPVAPPPRREKAFAPAPPPRRTTAASSVSAASAVTPYEKASTQASRKSSADLFASSIVRDLREPKSLRKAIVLREVLGPPVSMRDSSQSDHL